MGTITIVDGMTVNKGWLKTRTSLFHEVTRLRNRDFDTGCSFTAHHQDGQVKLRATAERWMKLFDRCSDAVIEDDRENMSTGRSFPVLCPTLWQTVDGITWLHGSDHIAW